MSRIWRPKTTEEKNRILDLWVTGISATTIAGLVGEGMTKSAVLGIVMRARDKGDPRAAHRTPNSHKTAHYKVRMGVPRRELKDAELRVERIGIKAQFRQEADLEMEKVVIAPDVKTVLNLKSHDCRWVMDGVTVDKLRIFCGQPVETALRPYCKEHYGLVYVKVRDDADVE